MEQDCSRRAFVAGGFALVASAGLGGCDGGPGGGSVVLPSAAAPEAALPPLTQGEMSVWQGLVGTTFSISGEKGRIDAKLTQVVKLDADPGRPADLARHDPFFAFFEIDPAAMPAGGQTYSVLHATKGRFDLFIGMPSELYGKGVVNALLN